jgi:hypothetical protein
MQAQSALRTLILNMQDYRKIRGDLAKSGGTVDAAFRQREAQDASVAWEGLKAPRAIWRSRWVPRYSRRPLACSRRSIPALWPYRAGRKPTRKPRAL